MTHRTPDEHRPHRIAHRVTIWHVRLVVAAALLTTAAVIAIAAY